MTAFIILHYSYCRIVTDRKRVMKAVLGKRDDLFSFILHLSVDKAYFGAISMVCFGSIGAGNNHRTLNGYLLMKINGSNIEIDEAQ